MSTSSIETYKLISAVKPRPPLYSRNERFEPGNRNTKAKLWKEVCEELNPAYKQMSNTEQLEYEREVYKRWRSLRTCFGRELALQRRDKLQKTPKRRKRYEHYDALKFLLADNDSKKAEYRDEDPDTEIQILFDSDEEVEAVDFEESSRSDGGTPRTVKSEIETENFPETLYIEPENPLPMHDSMLDPMDVVSKTQEADGDKLFMLSLIPSFRRINPRRKLAAKIELLKVLQSFQDD